MRKTLECVDSENENETRRFKLINTVRWQDWVVITLGGWLIASPWYVAYPLNRDATINGVVVGILLVIFNFMSVCRFKDNGQEVFNIMLGLWLMTSPYTMQFLTDQFSTINDIVLGFLIITFASWQMCVSNQSEN